MKIILSPIASDTDTIVSVDGLTITVDGIAYDLSVIPEGGDAQPGEGEPFIGTITREQVTIIYKYNDATAEPEQSTDWADYTFIDPVGEIPSPIVRKPEPEPEIEPEPEPEPEAEPEEQDDAN
jgi:hypothetical protein